MMILELLSKWIRGFLTFFAYVFEAMRRRSKTSSMSSWTKPSTYRTAGWRSSTKFPVSDHTHLRIWYWPTGGWKKASISFSKRFLWCQLQTMGTSFFPVTYS